MINENQENNFSGDKTSMSKTNVSGLASIFGSLDKYVKLDEWVYKQLDYALSENKNIKMKSELSSSWIYRLEYLLKGTAFEELEKSINNLYNTQNEFYKAKIKKLSEERAKITEEEIEKELEEYNHILFLTKKDKKDLSKSEKKELYQVYKRIKQEEADVFDVFNLSSFSEESLFGKKDITYLQEQVAIGLAEPRYMQIDEDLNWYRTKLIENKNKVENVYYLAVNRNVLINNFNEIKEIIRKIRYKNGENNKSIELVIDDDGEIRTRNSNEIKVPYSYSRNEINMLWDISTFVNHIYFSEYQPKALLPFDQDRIWTYKEVEKANIYKNFYVDELKKLNLTPFEKILMIHNYVTKYPYINSKKSESQDFGDIAYKYPKMFSEIENEIPDLIPVEFKRTFLTAHQVEHSSNIPLLKSQGKGFVCVGYSSYAKAMVDELKDPNIHCEFINPVAYDKSTGKRSWSHSSLLVKIKDEEYGIDGTYGWDPCWDSVSRGFSLCLYPLEDYLVYDKENVMIKISYHKRITTSEASLYTNGPKQIDVNNKNLFVCDEIDLNNSKPISYNTFSDALINVTKKTIENKKSSINLPKDFRSRSLTTSIHNLTQFNPQLAKNDFYQEIKAFYIENSKEGKYEDWEERFNEYNQNLEERPTEYEKS